MDSKFKVLLILSILLVLGGYGTIIYSVLALDLGIQWAVVFLCLIVLCLCTLKIFVLPNNRQCPRRRKTERTFAITKM